MTVRGCNRSELLGAGEEELRALEAEALQQFLTLGQRRVRPHRRRRPAALL